VHAVSCLETAIYQDRLRRNTRRNSKSSGMCRAGGGGIAHCVDPAVGAREWIRDWSTPADIPEMKRKTKAK
jgi:hypothetical protein